MEIENYFFDTEEEQKDIKYLVVVCYDISDNKRRRGMIKILEKYLFRVQRSVFEAMLSKNKFNRLKEELEVFIEEDEDLRIYKISGTGDVTTFGKAITIESQDIIII